MDQTECGKQFPDRCECDQPGCCKMKCYVVDRKDRAELSPRSLLSKGELCQLGSALPAGHVCSSAGMRRMRLEQFADFSFERVKSWSEQCHWRARPWKIDRHLRFNATRPSRKDGNSVRQIDGFLNLMCDENGAMPCLQPNTLEFILHLLSSLCIERGKGFVQQKKLRLNGQSTSQIRALLHSP